jgi:hypothetical protein
MCVTTEFENLVAAQFADTNTAVIFVPESGDVLLCDANDWEKLRLREPHSASELTITLKNLGLLIP